MGFHLAQEMVPSPCGQVSLFWKLLCCHIICSFEGYNSSPDCSGSLCLPPPSPSPQPSTQSGVFSKPMIGFENHFNLILGKKFPKLFLNATVA